MRRNPVHPLIVVDARLVVGLECVGTCSARRIHAYTHLSRCVTCCVSRISGVSAQEATKNRLRTLLREIAERRDSKDDPEDQNLEGLWAVKPEVDIHLVTAQVHLLSLPRGLFLGI